MGRFTGYFSVNGDAMIDDSELEVDTEWYSLWGGSAGARMAAILGNGNAISHF